MTQRILQIVSTLQYSDTSRQAARLAIALAGRGFDVHLCAIFAAEDATLAEQLQEELRRGGVSVESIGQRRPYDPQSLLRLKRHIARLQPDLVHTWPSSANTLGRIAARWARVGGIVSSERGVDRWKSRRRLFLDRCLARRGSRMIFASRAAASFYAYHRVVFAETTAALKPANVKIEVICDGVATPDGIATPNGAAISRADFFRQLGIPGDARLIGAVGQLWPRKRVKDLIWAADLLKVIRDDVHLVIIGESPRGRPQHGWRLERFRDQVDIADKVHFVLPASLTRAFSCGVLELAPLVSPHFAAFWQGSHHEGAALGMLEAMAAATPIVASDIPAHRELIQTDQQGLLVPVGDRAEFATKTNKLLDDAQMHERLSRGARQRAVAEFSFDTMVDRHVEVYRRVLSQ